MNDIEALRVVICQKMGVCKYYGGRCNTTRCAVEPDVARAALQAIIARWMEPDHAGLEVGHDKDARVFEAGREAMARNHMIKRAYDPPEEWPVVCADARDVWQAMLSEKAKEVDDG